MGCPAPASGRQCWRAATAWKWLPSLPARDGGGADPGNVSATQQRPGGTEAAIRAASPSLPSLPLTGELDITDAVALGVALTRVVARPPVIDVDLTPRRPWGSPALPFWVMTWIV